MPRVVAILVAIALPVIVGLFFLRQTSEGSYEYDPNRAVYHTFSGDLAFEHLTKLVGFGPRPSGSNNLEASRQYLEQVLTAAGWATERQIFDQDTPIGNVTFVNVRARFLGRRNASKLWETPASVLVGSHYDTKKYSEFEFVGANDSGSSTAALLEIGRVTAKRPDVAHKLELVFFDGEEAFNPNIDANDGLYGSRYYGKRLRRLAPKEKPKFGIVLDMIGDKQLNIGVPADSPPQLYRWMMQAAKDLGFESYFGKHDTAILDDHLPLNQSGVPSIDIIDLDYGTWHTKNDTMKHVSAESISIVSKTTLLLIEKYALVNAKG